MTTSEALEGALVKLDNGNGWAKNWFAFDAEGNKVYGLQRAFSENKKFGPEVKYCAAGAIRAAIWGSYTAFEDAAWDREKSALSMQCVDCLGINYVQTNDDPETEWPAVEVMFRAAITKAKLAEAAA